MWSFTHRTALLGHRTSFLSTWNGIGMISPSKSPPPSAILTSDASGSWGGCAFWQNRWLQLSWDPISACESIEVKELVPIVMATAMWGTFWSGTTVQCLCDNMSVVHVLSSRTSRSKPIMHLLHCLFFIEALHACRITASHIPASVMTWLTICLEIGQRHS